MHSPIRVKLLISALALLASAVGLVSPAIAQPRPNVYNNGNRWLITAYDDTSPTHTQWATQGICFLPYAPVGTHIQGVWYSDTFPNWRGRYSQEGDRILMHGDYANDVGHDGMQHELFAGASPNDEAAGQWIEWRETGLNGTTIGFVNSRLRRVGRCTVPPNVDISKLNQEELEKLSVELSRQVKPRLRRDGKPAEHPIDREQVPLQSGSGN